MKKILLLSLCATALGLTTSALAQAAGPVGGPPQSAPEGRQKGNRKAMEKMNEEILAKLNLTEEQKTKLKAHKEEMAGKLKGLRKGGDREEAKEKIKALRKEQQQFMKTLLTKDQMKEFAKLRMAAMKEMREKKAAPQP